MTWWLHVFDTCMGSCSEHCGAVRENTLFCQELVSASFPDAGLSYVVQSCYGLQVQAALPPSALKTMETLQGFLTMSPNDFTPVHSGPIEQLLDYNRIRSGMYWVRL